MTENRDTMLPQGWKSVALGNFALIVQGQSPSGDTYNTSGKGLPFLQGKAEFGSLYPAPNRWCSDPAKIAEAEDVLISIRAPVGPSNICSVKSCIGRGLAAIRPLGGVPSRYILYLLRAAEQDLVRLATGSTFQAIRGDVLNSHLIPVAPLPEQRRIVAEIEKQLTRLDAAVAALKRARANLKRYRAAVLKAACEGRLVPTEAELARAEGRDYEPASALLARILRERRARWEAEQRARGRGPARYAEPVPPDTAGLPPLPEGWVWTRLGQVAAVKGGVTKGERQRPGVPYREVAYLRVANVQRGYLDLSEVKTIKATEADISALRLEPGDILFNEGGDRDKLGRGWVWAGEVGECIHQNHVLRARPFSRDIEPKFVSYYANSAGQTYMLTKGKQTTNLASISMTLLVGLPVPLPPFAEQQRIVAEVERRLSIVRIMEAALDANLKRAERLRQSILKRAFEGRLVPQDPSDEPASALLERIRAERAAQRSNGAAPRRGRGRRAAAAATYEKVS